MNSRQRVQMTLNHQEPDRVPLDLGGCSCSSMSASAVYQLRQALKLDPPGTPVKVTEPYQILGDIAPDLQAALGVDVVSLRTTKTMFGYRNEGWKPWTLFDGTPVLVPAGFNTDLEPDGSILMYPEGDKSVPPSGRMPAGGYYFDSIPRQDPIDDAHLDPADNLEDFGPISASDLQYLADEAKYLYDHTDQAILANFGGTAFGDIALVPGPWIKHPRGIRDVAEWYMSTVSRRDYVWKVFERQCEIALQNLQTIHEKVGEHIHLLFLSGTDFGTQAGPMISPKTYRSLFMPFNKQLNDWVHKNTTWKTFIHSCGSVAALIPSFIEAGFDVINPVQTTAVDMEEHSLKERFGREIVFWGGGVDTQHTLPFGKPEEVRSQVRDRIRTFGPGGGFVFNTVHNVQALTPVENILAMYQAVKDFGAYPLN